MITPTKLNIFKREADYAAGTYTIERLCASCGKSRYTTIDSAELFRYSKGAKVQDAFPGMSPEDRDFYFMAGLCPKCWNELFSKEES